MKESVRDVVLKLKEDGSIFRRYREEDLELILPYLSLYEYPAGTTVTRPGEVVEMLGVLVSGHHILYNPGDVLPGVAISHGSGGPLLASARTRRTPISTEVDTTQKRPTLLAFSPEEWKMPSLPS